MASKHLNSVSFVVLALILIGSTAWGAGFAVNGIGTKATSLGGGFRGLADDWSACFWNPAGLGFLESSELNTSLSASLFLPKYNPDVLYGDLYEVGFKNGAYRYPENRFYFLPNFSGFYKLPKQNIVVGMGFYTSYELESHYWSVFEPLPGYDNLVSYPKDDYGPNIMIVDFHPTLAKAFSEKLSLGLGLSFNWADFKLTKVTLAQTGYDAPLQNIPIDSKLKMDGWGVGFNLGMLYKISPKMQMGVSITSPVNIKVEGDMNYTAYLPNHIEVDTSFTGGTLASIPKAKATLNLPASAGVGFAYFSSDKLTFTFDGSWTGWSRWDELEVNLTGKDPFGETATSPTLAYNWNDVFKIALGCEYMYKDKLAIRGGYSFESSLIPNSTLDIIVPDVGPKHGFSLGLGYEFENNIELGLGQQLVLSPSKTIDKIEDANNDGVYDNLPGEYGNMSYSTHLSLTYRF
ncbi:MAG TPA: outer membrane protein transport protein [candidate division Zixibacteria bacterium]